MKGRDEIFEAFHLSGVGRTLGRRKFYRNRISLKSQILNIRSHWARATIRSCFCHQLNFTWSYLLNRTKYVFSAITKLSIDRIETEIWGMDKFRKNATGHAWIHHCDTYPDKLFEVPFCWLQPFVDQSDLDFFEQRTIREKDFASCFDFFARLCFKVE